MTRYGVLARAKFIQPNGKIAYLRLASLPTGFKIFSDLVGHGKGTRICLMHTFDFQPVNDLWGTLILVAEKNNRLVEKGDKCRSK